MKSFLWKFTQGLIALVGLLGGAITIYSFCNPDGALEDIIPSNNVLTFLTKHPRVFISAIIILLTTLLVIFSFVSLYRLDKKNTDIAESMHQFFHDLRLKIFKMQKDIDKYKNHELFYTMIKDVCTKLCEDISSFIKAKTGKDFSVCIKMINSDAVVTLSRSGKDMRTRNELDEIRQNNNSPVLIKDNTAFSSILNENAFTGQKAVFACSNLYMLKILGRFNKNKIYKNSTPNFLKYYKSTIVVPIRISNKYNVFNHNHYKKNNNIVIGFLCIDYKKPISKALKNELVGYIKGFGDSLFILFKQIVEFDEQIKKDELKNQTPKKNTKSNKKYN